MKLLVDTNILLDVLEKREPFRRPAEHLWRLVEAGRVDAVISAISFNNVFYLARKSLGTGPALDALRELRRVFGVIPLDEQVVDEALKLAKSDFEDAIQAVAARRAGAQYVVTRNAGDFVVLGVKTLTAEQALGLLVP